MTNDNAAAVAHRLWGQQAFAEEYPHSADPFAVGWKSYEPFINYDGGKTTAHVYGRGVSWEEAFADAMKNFPKWKNEP